MFTQFLTERKRKQPQDFAENEHEPKHARLTPSGIIRSLYATLTRRKENHFSFMELPPEISDKIARWPLEEEAKKIILGRFKERGTEVMWKTPDFLTINRELRKRWFNLLYDAPQRMLWIYVDFAKTRVSREKITAKIELGVKAKAVFDELDKRYPNRKRAPVKLALYIINCEYFQLVSLAIIPRLVCEDCFPVIGDNQTLMLGATVERQYVGRGHEDYERQMQFRALFTRLRDAAQTEDWKSSKMDAEGIEKKTLQWLAGIDEDMDVDPKGKSSRQVKAEEDSLEALQEVKEMFELPTGGLILTGNALDEAYQSLCEVE